ncbi:ABC transporter ATP-binding protein (plasmid) [Azospirillum argentinense]|uniref:ABC transporter ATP-binding protein n=1 Tax=Azospirillum argentinense TaxID=2970906 RepID=A0A4D8PXM5_9PROT|nr:ABC transporter ATP-binding protein [Azospirillum argentinense]QCN99389.1 ABC transporter ATP-binding protein [Azospirillum argentinense]
MPTPPILTVQDVSISFGAVRAVNGVSLALAPGERHALLGTNGAGKTTLFNAISGEVPLTAGGIAFKTRDISRLRPHQRARLGIGRTFQTSLTFADRSVEDNLRVAVMGSRGPRFSVRPWRHHRKQVEAARACAARFRLDEVMDQPVGTLSYGQQRELEIAMALAGEPELLLMDEPAAGMSPQGRGRLVEILRGLPRRITMLFVEHDMDVALSLADRITVMRDGAVVASGTPSDIRANPLVREIYLGGKH